MKCYCKFLRQYGDSSNIAAKENNIEDNCFISTMKHLSNGLSRGEIYSIATVWEKYCEFLAQKDTAPGIYRSNKFKERIKKFVKLFELSL